MFSKNRELPQFPRNLKRSHQTTRRKMMLRQQADVLAEEEHTTGARPLDARDDIEERRLAGTVRADQAGDLSNRQIEIHARDGFQAAIGFSEPSHLEKRRVVSISLNFVRKRCERSRLRRISHDFQVQSILERDDG